MASLSPSAAAPASGYAFSSSARTTVTMQQLSAFAMRNVATPGSCGGELMDLYFKLVVDGHVVYVSEIVRNTLNPVWMPFEPEIFAHEFDGTSTYNGAPLFCGTVFDIVVVRVRNYKMARRKSSALYGKIMADEAGTEDDEEDEDEIEDGDAPTVEKKQEPTTGFVFSGVNKVGGAFDFIEDDEDSDLEEKDAIPESECTTLVMSRAPSQRRKSTTIYEEEILTIPFNIRELDPLPIGLTEISNLPLNTCLLEFNARLYVKREVIELLVEMGVIAAKHSRRKGSTIQLKEYSLHDGIDNLERIRTLKKQIEEVTMDTQSLQEQIKQRLVGAEMNVVKDHKRGTVQERILALRRQIAEKRDTMDRLKAVMQDERRTFETDIHIPKALLNMMQMSMRYKDEKQGILERRCEVLRAAHKIRSRQAMLVKELGTVYPIEYVGVGEYSIRGIKISNSDLSATGRADDEQLSTALGYIAHLVFMLSKYLHVNLRYKIMPYSSRSYIKDEINDPHGEYPLYRKGVERDRFERAIFFLRKDVEQLQFARGQDPTQNHPLLMRLKALTEAEIFWLASERGTNPGATPPKQA